MQTRNDVCHGAELDIDQGAIPAQQFVAPLLCSHLHQLFPACCRPVPLLGQYQILDRPAGQLFATVSGQRACGRIDIDIASLVIGQNDRVLCMLEEGLQPAAAFA